MVTINQVKGLLSYCSSMSRSKWSGIKHISELKYAPPPPPPLRTNSVLKSSFKLETSPILKKSTVIPEKISFEQINNELLGDIAEYIHLEGKKDYDRYFNTFKNAFKDTGAKLSGRTKCPPSIYVKLDKRKRYLSDPNKTLLENAYNVVPDLNGYKAVTSGKTEDIDKIVKQIETLVDSNELIPSHFFNYGQVPYLNPQHLKRLKALGFYFNDIKKKSGFSCVNMYFFDIKGKHIELQIIGEMVDKINKKDHLFYNFNTKGAATENGVINHKYQNLFKKMSSVDKENYYNYTEYCYYCARILERGYARPSAPFFSKNWDKALKLI